MNINIISIGKLSKEYRALALHYLKMIKWKIKETELSYAKKLPQNSIKPYEAKLIDQYINQSAYKIILDVAGKQLPSEEFSLIFKNQMMHGRDVDIIIGGAFGFDRTILKAADIILSLSTLTLPHQLAKVVLLEQLYRAQTILEGHPYHK